jgi:hypothetical protein
MIVLGLKPISEKPMRKTRRIRTTTKTRAKKVARLYHFEPQTVDQIEFLGQLFGGKEKGIAAAVDMAASVLKGEKSELQISIK